MMPGVLLAFFGFFQIMLVQHTKASIDTSEMTREMLGIMRNGAAQYGQSYSVNTNKELVHKGYTVPWKNNVYTVNGIGFSSAEFAIEHIDRYLSDGREVIIDGYKQSDRSSVPVGGVPGYVIKVYQGQQIIREQDGVSVGERKFANVMQAERWLDGG